MSSPLYYRVTFWEALPVLAGLLSSSLVHGFQEGDAVPQAPGEWSRLADFEGWRIISAGEAASYHETRADAEEAAILGVSKGAARADLSAAYRRSTRRLGSYSPGSPSALSAVWRPA